MPCYEPLTGYYSRDVGASGKRRITFSRGLSLSGEPLRLPCGQCVGCRLEKSRQWAMRCLHEKKFHALNCFLTLTYDDEHLPPGGSLVKRDLQLFMKRLRKAVGHVRFYACGEYGDRNRRPHYHALIFGYDFPDKVRVGENKRGDSYYDSKLLRKLWFQGHVLLGDVTFDSAAYVARYVMKKITGEKAKEHYEVCDGYGEVFTRLPEFTVMSRRPGIGSSYYEKYGVEVRSLDSVVINSREVRPPRFYDTRTERVDPARLAVIKRVRRRKALLFRAEQTPERRRVRAELARRMLEQKERKL